MPVLRFLVTLACLAVGVNLADAYLHGPRAGAVLESGAFGLRLPVPEPQLLPGMEPLIPPALAQNPGSPTISEHLRTAGPDETLTLSGDFKPGSTTFEIYAEGAGVQAIVPLYLDGVAAAIVVPASIPAWSTYLLWPKTGEMRGAPVIVNRTEAWWVGPRMLRPGQPFSVYGRNLSHRNGTTVSYVYMQGEEAPGRWLNVTAVNPYAVTAVIPAVKPGRYEVWIHNGHGGRFGWSGPLAVEVNAAEAQPLPSAFVDVRRFGAKGDGIADDGEAVQNALDFAAKAAPATVLFPAGEYAIRRALMVPSQVRWLGEGRDRTRIRFAVPLSALGETAMMLAPAPVNDATFEAIEINADGMIDVTNRGMIGFNGSGIQFLDARLRAFGGSTVQMTATGLRFERTDITDTGLFLGDSRQVFFDRNTFRMMGDGEAAVTIWGGREIAFTGNRLENADDKRPDGSGIGRLFVAQGHFGSTMDMFFADNETLNSAPRDCDFVDCNKGEQILWEFGSLNPPLPATAVTADSVTLARLALRSETGPQHVMVLAGRGAGQTREVVRITGNTVVLDRPWTVMPDLATSRFSVDSIAARAVVYRNRFEGRDSFAMHNSNSTAVLVWGSCRDIVIAENQVSKMRRGIMLAATSGTAADGVSAPAFALITRNEVRGGYDGLYTGLAFGFDTDASAYGGFGNVFRRNLVEDMTRVGIALDAWNSKGGAMAVTSFEHNVVRNVQWSLVAALKMILGRETLLPVSSRATPYVGTVLYRNRLDGPWRRPVALDAASPTPWIEIGTIVDEDG
jgi:polygalacturonase